jgi:hypothetical protein
MHIANLVRAPLDPGVFAEVHAQPRRRTLAYLTLLVIIATAVTTVGLTRRVRAIVDDLLEQVDKLPTIRIRDGVAEADVEQPWIHSFGERDGKELVAIIDTTGEIDDLAEDQVGVLLVETELVVKGDEGVSERIPLSRFGDVELGPQIARQWLVKARRVASLSIAVCAFVYHFLAKLIQVLLLTLVGLIASSSRRHPLRFRSLFTVGTYALTLPILLTAFHIPFVYFPIAVFYVAIGVGRIPDEA